MTAVILQFPSRAKPRTIPITVGRQPYAEEYDRFAEARRELLQDIFGGQRPCDSEPDGAA